MSANTSSYNKLDGILADVTAQEAGNTFTSNTLANNIRYGAEDLSSGAGTAGTANTWSTNTCSPAGNSFPSGLC